MAMASVRIRCKVCGREFEHRKEKQNRAEADAYEAWALENIDTCPECFTEQKKIKAQENAQEDRQKANEIMKGIELPKIQGASAAQIAYAENLRAKYIAKYPKRMINAAKRKAGVEAMQRDPQKAAETEAKLREIGSDVQEGWHKIATKFGDYEMEYMLLTEREARAIIDRLKYIR